MSKLFALMTNDDSLVPVALAEERDLIHAVFEDAGGLGLGWFQKQRSLLKKYPAVSAQEIVIERALASLTTPAMIACLSDAPEHVSSAQSMSPYRFQQWLYAQHGHALDDIVRQRCVAALPEFLKINIHSEEDAECMFFSLLHSLHAHDVYHSPTHKADRRALAMHNMIHAMTQLDAQAVEAFACINMTRDYLLAYQHDAPLWYRTWRGIDEAAPEPMYEGQRTRAQHHRHFKGTMLLSSTSSPGPAWSPIPQGHVLWMSTDWEVHLVPPDEAPPTT